MLTYSVHMKIWETLSHALLVFCKAAEFKSSDRGGQKYYSKDLAAVVVGNSYLSN